MTSDPLTFPRRIVCLSDEAAELIYLLGEDHRIVGVSGFSTRPPEVRSKPRVSTFRDANFEAISALDPDLLITYSDVQADISREASLRGLTVLNCPHRPRVYFEEWTDPLISGIQWVEELVEIAGGDPIFPELRTQRKAQDRVISWQAVVDRNPDVILASWCGMKVNKDEILARPAAGQITAIRTGQIHEIPSSVILQPGPAALTEGVRVIHNILANAARTTSARPQES